MDAARTIIRHNHSLVTCIFFRGPEDVTCNKIELEYAIIDGVQMMYYVNTVKILEDGIIVEPVIKQENEDGSISYINDEKNAYKIPSTSVIIAIGQGPQDNFASKEKIETNEKGLIKANANGVTSKPGVFAAGDVVSGAKTVVEAVAFTKIVAKEIEDYCKSKKDSK